MRRDQNLLPFQRHLSQYTLGFTISPTTAQQSPAGLQMFQDAAQAPPEPPPHGRGGFCCQDLRWFSPTKRARCAVRDLVKRHPGTRWARGQQEKEGRDGGSPVRSSQDGPDPGKRLPTSRAGWTDRQTGLTWDVVDGYSEDHQHNPPPAAAAGCGGTVPGHGERRGAVG